MVYSLLSCHYDGRVLIERCPIADEDATVVLRSCCRRRSTARNQRSARSGRSFSRRWS